MKQKTRRILSGLSVAGLVAAGSIPLMGADAKKTDKNAGAKPKDNVTAPKKCSAMVADKSGKAKPKDNVTAPKKCAGMTQEKNAKAK
jgi:hypothetical protein